MVEAEVIDSVRTSPLITNNSGGVAWLRLEDDIKMDALMIGDIEIKNVIAPNSEFAKWQSFTLESQTVASPCNDVQETGALVVQGLYGQATRLVINGISIDLNGTIVVLTEESTTKFIAIEGRVRLISFSQPVILNAGQQLTIAYPAGDWTTPNGLPGNAEVLDYDLIKNLPTVLFDRPVEIPQPGFVQTEGRVNMRTEPDINSQLLFQVPAGETMSVLGLSTDRDWYHIRLGNGETGWMNAELLVQNVGIVQQVYDTTPAPPQRLGQLASQASVIVGQGGNLREAPDVGFGVMQTIPSVHKLNYWRVVPIARGLRLMQAVKSVGWHSLQSKPNR